MLTPSPVMVMFLGMLYMIFSFKGVRHGSTAWHKINISYPALPRVAYILRNEENLTRR